MLEQTKIAQLRQAAALAGDGNRPEAAALCRRVLAAEPNNLAALLWLTYSSPVQLESEEAVARAYDQHPHHPAVLQAVDWYNTYFVDVVWDMSPNASSLALKPAPPLTGPETGQPASPSQTVMHTPVGEPILDSPNFFASQTGSLVIGSTIFLVVNLFIFLNYTFIRGINWTPFGLPRLFYAFVALVIVLLAGAFLIYTIRDVLTPPIKAHGFISNRRIIRRQVKSEAGQTSEFYYELDFMADPGEPGGPGSKPVRLTLTKEQFEFSDRTNRAFVIYTRRLGVVKLYQPLRSVF
jgi:hypothetical protein